MGKIIYDPGGIAYVIIKNTMRSLVKVLTGLVADKMKSVYTREAVGNA